jgi:alkylation response protein AidB-like acyl-CoA dehydrogenase
VRPVSAELDARQDPAESWSWGVVEEASRRGLRQAPAPPEYGGDDTTFLTDVVMPEEIAAADVGAAVVLAQHWKFLQMIKELATPDQLDRWMRRIAENPRALLAAAFTEPDAASDNFLPYTAPGGGMQSRAERCDGGYVLNGMKHFISNANRADVIISFLRTDPSGPIPSSVSAFLVASDTPGLAIGRVHDKTGERLANNAEVFYRAVFIPEGDRLGDEGAAMTNVAKLLRGSNAYAAACALGVARECYDRTVRFCRQRVQGGKPIVEHENIAAYLADMYLDVDVSRTYVYRAAWQAIESGTFDNKLGITPKLVVSERTFDTARRAMELWGGRGVMKENGIEKLMRDAAIWLHSDGTNILMRMKLANQLRAGEDGFALWDQIPVEEAEVVGSGPAASAVPGQ